MMGRKWTITADPEFSGSAVFKIESVVSKNEFFKIGNCYVWQCILYWPYCETGYPSSDLLQRPKINGWKPWGRRSQKRDKKIRNTWSSHGGAPQPGVVVIAQIDGLRYSSPTEYSLRKWSSYPNKSQAPQLPRTTAPATHRPLPRL